MMHLFNPQTFPSLFSMSVVRALRDCCLYSLSVDQQVDCVHGFLKPQENGVEGPLGDTFGRPIACPLPRLTPLISFVSAFAFRLFLLLSMTLVFLANVGITFGVFGNIKFLFPAGEGLGVCL